MLVSDKAIFRYQPAPEAESHRAGSRPGSRGGSPCGYVLATLLTDSSRCECTGSK